MMKKSHQTVWSVKRDFSRFLFFNKNHVIKNSIGTRVMVFSTKIGEYPTKAAKPKYFDKIHILE